MRILVTGASSFVGAHFCRLAALNHDVVGLYHSNPLALSGVTPMRVDLRRARCVERLREAGADAVVHIATKIKARPSSDEESAGEAAARVNRELMDTVLGVGKPVVYASSTVVHWDQVTPYGQARRDDEAALAASGLPHAIVRPSAPYGPRLATHKPRHKESFHTLVDLVRKLPVVPVVGDGQYRRQPLHVDDFSASMLAFLDQGFPNAAFDAGGAEPLTFDEVIDTIGRALGKSVRKLHLPKALFVQAAKLSKDFDPSLLAAMDEDEIADPAALSAATGVRFRSFADGVRCLV